ncbi:hypothetical protein B1806_03960 [Metallibacterium scheffleri]|uniref:Uncharacterized protein n=1 Tax=Metallibacterium scheffleri TaxID=993689 RepID=A0A4S3KQI0_9GAMM|nr:hypothetical protein B1806_03960 [Metallibacterium scheffleri]
MQEFSGLEVCQSIGAAKCREIRFIKMQAEHLEAVSQYIIDAASVLSDGHMEAASVSMLRHSGVQEPAIRGKAWCELIACGLALRGPFIGIRRREAFTHASGAAPAIAAVLVHGPVVHVYRDG